MWTVYIVPVSYTHLDVYKRQPETFREEQGQYQWINWMLQTKHQSRYTKYLGLPKNKEGRQEDQKNED